MGGILHLVTTNRRYRKQDRRQYTYHAQRKLNNSQVQEITLLIAIQLNRRNLIGQRSRAVRRLASLRLMSEALEQTNRQTLYYSVQRRLQQKQLPKRAMATRTRPGLPLQRRARNIPCTRGGHNILSV